ncbi:MAG: rod shape-determining protein MreD [Dehalobacterium sp.]
MRSLVFIVAIILSIIIQSSFNFLNFGITPDLLLILVLFTAVLEGPVVGFKVGLIVGLVEDLVAGKYFGIYILTKMLTGVIIGLVEPKIFKENYLVPVVTLFFGTIIHEFFFIFFGNIIGMNILLGENMWHRVLPLAIYQAILAPFIYVPFYKIYFSKWLNRTR